MSRRKKINIMSQPNPYVLTIPASDTGFISCSSHARYFQKVTITGSPSGTAVFTGSGEDVPMTCNGQNSLVLPSSVTGYALTILFQFSKNGSVGPFSNSVINNAPIITTVGNLTIVNIESEDSSDHDDNDTLMNIIYQS
jgi:hypothetical protein